MSLATLEKLLEDKTVFVLGAGSSKPYGFPLWDDLKKVILEKCDQLSDTSEYSELGLAYWESCLNKDDEKSVDTLAKEANDSSRKGFQTIVGRYLISCEASDLESNKSDWVGSRSFILRCWIFAVISLHQRYCQTSPLLI